MCKKSPLNCSLWINRNHTETSLQNKITVYVSLKRRVRSTLYDLYCPYFLPEVIVKFTRKAKGQLVVLIWSSIHLITWISGRNWKSNVVLIQIFTWNYRPLFHVIAASTTLRLSLGNAAEGHLFVEVKLCSWFKNKSGRIPPDDLKAILSQQMVWLEVLRRQRAVNNFWNGDTIR